MKVLMLTREYPPHVYGGAGVHVEHLAREVARHAEVEVRCFGDQDSGPGNPRVRGYRFGDDETVAVDAPARDALRAAVAGIHAVSDPIEADVVHCHTWYTHWGGMLARLGFGVPLVVTVHSLEPRRPWKREQLGGGYDLSTWIERNAIEHADAVIAVSSQDREDLLRLYDVREDRVAVVPNGVDASVYRRAPDPAALAARGVDPAAPYVLFLGRVTRQKGIAHFLRACDRLPAGAQVVLCASSPDTPEIEAETARAVEALGSRRRVVWIREMVPREVAIALYSGAAVFCCPSVYEPFGIINLEAMACETPVVATAVGGIRDVVADGETGFLVDPRSSRTDGEPDDPERLAEALADAVERLLRDEALRRDMGRRGRDRAVREFGWDRVAERVLEIYREVAGRNATDGRNER